MARHSAIVSLCAPRIVTPTIRWLALATFTTLFVMFIAIRRLSVDMVSHGLFTGRRRIIVVITLSHCRYYRASRFSLKHWRRLLQAWFGRLRLAAAQWHETLRCHYDITGVGVGWHTRLLWLVNIMRRRDVRLSMTVTVTGGNG